MAASQAQLGVIDAQKANIALQITKSEVKAPADGLVLARNATLGGIVSSTGGPLFRIAISGELEFAAAVAETALPRLKPGMKATVVPAGGDPIEGTIRRISPRSTRSRGSAPSASSLGQDGSGRVRAGSYARGEIEALRRTGLAVPASAVTFQGEAPFLQVVENGKVRSVAVTLGARAEGQVEVLSGIVEGTEVVARAGTFVATATWSRPCATNKPERSRDEIERLGLVDPQPGSGDPFLPGADGARLMAFAKLPITRFPNIDVPLVSVTVTDSGAAPAELETQVTKRDRRRGLQHHRRQARHLDDHRRHVDDLRSSSVSRSTRRPAVNDVKDAIAAHPLRPAGDVRGAGRRAHRCRRPGDPDLCGVGAGA